jgi:hypothetical protein
MRLKRVDRAWILVRRAAGVDQRGGARGRVFATTAIVGAIGFTAWLLLIGGLGAASGGRVGPLRPHWRGARR